MHQVPLHQHLVQVHLQVLLQQARLVHLQVHQAPPHQHLVQVHQQALRLQARLVHPQVHPLQIALQR